MHQVQGTMKLARLAKALAEGVNVKRKAKGLLPRAVGSSAQVKPNMIPFLFISLLSRLLMHDFIVMCLLVWLLNYKCTYGYFDIISLLTRHS